MKGQGNILKEVKLWQLIIHTICHNNSNLNMRRPLMYRSRGDMGGGRKSYGEKPIYYDEREFPMELRDSREGRSPMSRRMYMESKELHKDKDTKIRELDKYMKELSEDLVEMISDASPEEKQLLEKKVSALVTRISSLNHA